MKKRGSLAWAAALILLAGPLLLAQEDIQRHPSCKYCGMDRAMFAHSRMLVEYEDGSSVGVCSLHCAVLELVLNIGSMPKSVRVGDHDTKALVDAEKASWVIGGRKPGVMTDRAKWAFREPADAKKFMAEFGGTGAVFDLAVKAAFEDIYRNWQSSWDKRKKILEEMR